ncbi:MAG: hypothetical protein ABS46_01530 [Cytophagaceae bacterium SCN 52-12]|nr:MAG: hypothetical protein ABS46_01530 [Cytophagaceae bacterium SCN 52-12]
MKILLIGSPYGYMKVLSVKMRNEGYEVEEANSLPDAQFNLKAQKPEVAICCLPWSKEDRYMTIIAALREASPGTDLIIIDSHIELNVAVDLLHAGVFSCFNYPFIMEQLFSTLSDLGQRRAAPLPHSPGLPPDLEFVKGTSYAAKKMFHHIDLVAPTNFNVVIYGETGTGKEVVARLIARQSGTDNPFVAVDCGCLSKELALSELFGHEKGSFTGAMAKKTGAFETAHNGTLFLDEISNLDYEVQGFLLRAIQEKKIRRVGSTTDLPVRTRLIVATNKDLGEMVEKGQFREDLYHRINEFQIVVPPLRSRIEDLYTFLAHFLTETNRELKKNVLMPAEATFASLFQYSWPGNLRELKNVVRRACLLCATGTAIQGDLLPGYITKSSPEKTAANCELQHKAGRTARSITLKDIQDVLIQTNYNKSETARVLGIDRKTLYNRLRNVISETGYLSTK